MSRAGRAVALAFALSVGTAEAQVARVFVSVNGNDANVCSNIATPCRTFAGGITQVDAQGEVIVVDSGSYAGGTITKSVKINVASGVVAFSGLPITADPGAGGVVVLRGLTIKAATPGSGNGIMHISGTLFVEDTVVDGWQRGIYTANTGSAPEKLFVKGSVSRNNTMVGLATEANTAVAFSIDGSFFENNSSGIALFGGTGRVSNSTMTGNSTGAHVGNAGVQAAFQRCEVSGNGTVGLRASNGSTLRVSGSTIVQNGIGLELLSGATVERFGNNLIRGNTTNLSGAIAAVGLQ